MKSISALMLVLVLTTGFTPAIKAKQGSLTFKFSVINIVEGYDHDSKLVVYEDGKMLGESSVQEYFNVPMKDRNVTFVQKFFDIFKKMLDYIGYNTHAPVQGVTPGIRTHDILEDVKGCD